MVSPVGRRPPVRCRLGSRRDPIIDQTEIVRAFWEEVWTVGRVELLPSIFAPGAVENGDPIDLEAFAEGVAATRRAFPDFVVSVFELLGAGPDRVVSRVGYSGTHTSGPYLGLAPSGRRFEAIGIDLLRLHDGRVIELWHSVDHLTIVSMLGGRVVPRSDTP